MATKVHERQLGGAVAPGAPVDLSRLRIHEPADVSELGLAKELTRRLTGRAVFVRDTGRWLVWDGKRCRKGEAPWALIQEFVEAVAEAFSREAAEDSGHRSAWKQKAAKVRSKRALEALEQLARRQTILVIDGDRLDADRLLLNTPAGIVDLRSGELSPHDPKKLLTKLTGVPMDPVAGCPRFLDFLDRISGGNPDVVEFLRVALGYSITGLTREQVFFLCIGPGANGKTTLMEVVRALMGDYAANASFDTFLATSRDRIPADLARLRGARLVTAAEPTPGRYLDEARIKAWTGGDAVTARQLYGTEFEFRPTGKLWLLTNAPPAVRDDSEGFWRRCLVVPFDVTIPEGEREPDLARRLVEEEGEAILAWLVAGARKYLAEGRLPIPACIRTARQRYRRAQNPLADFLDEECVREEGAFTLFADLWKRYQDTGSKYTTETLTRAAFGRALAAAGLREARRGGSRGRLGIRLREPGERDE